VQSEEPHVMDHLSKFHLNRTVNEQGNAVLRKLHELEKWWRPAPKIRKVAPGGTILLPGGSCSAKNMKNNVFRESEYYTSLVWRLAANWVLLGGSCNFRNPAALPLRLRTSVFFPVSTGMQISINSHTIQLLSIMIRISNASIINFSQAIQHQLIT